jgi:hypothetical protein
MDSAKDPLEDEICRIEQDIENLERRYAELETAVRLLKVGFGMIAIALIALAIAGVVIQRGGIIVSAMVGLLLIGIGVLAGPRSVMPSLAWNYERSWRWIDAVGWRPDGPKVKRSEAMAIEDMIADRQRRLGQLRKSD